MINILVANPLQSVKSTTYASPDSWFPPCCLGLASCLFWGGFALALELLGCFGCMFTIIALLKGTNWPMRSDAFSVCVPLLLTSVDDRRIPGLVKKRCNCIVSVMYHPSPTHLSREIHVQSVILMYQGLP